MTQRNGKERLEQIREAVESGDTSSLLELAFLPMYGNDDDIDKTEFVKDIIGFETELFKKIQRFCLDIKRTATCDNRFFAAVLKKGTSMILCFYRQEVETFK